MSEVASETKSFQLDIVSVEAALFSDAVTAVHVAGAMGELGIYPGHCQLLTALIPGQIKAVLLDGKEEIFYLSGGLLEVQPHKVTILADNTALRAEHLDEATVLQAKEAAERKVAHQKSEVEYSTAMTELAETMAQLKVIHSLRKQRK